LAATEAGKNHGVMAKLGVDHTHTTGPDDKETREVVIEDE